MQKPFLALVGAASLLATLAVPATAQTIPGGSYQQSCTNIRVRGNQLLARCTASNGTATRSSVALNSCSGDIANVNGQLTCANTNGRYHRPGYGNGGYNNGNGNRDNGYGRGNRDERDNHGDRDNRGDRDDHRGNGNNGYGNNGYGNNGTAPGGSYQQSCSNVQMRGSMLTATCTNANGSPVTTTINVNRCNGNDISNNNGRLVCG